jgi:uncharacterized protein (TIGR02145 family)
MKNSFKIAGVVFIIFLIYSCKIDKPKVTTAEVTDISYTTVSSGGEVTDEGDRPVFARGVCWNTSENPTVYNNRTSDGTGPGSFSSNLTELTPGTRYYIRAYAVNSIGYGYGNQVSFSTASVSLPDVTTETVSSIQPNSAISGGNIPGEIYSNERGVCWSTTSNPTINGSRTTDGSGFGSFTSSLINLSGNTTYYVRAYATNSYGTGYGEELQFITLVDYSGQSGTVNDIDGNTYATIGIGSQIWMAENLKTTRYRNGDLISTTTSSISGEITPVYQWPYGDNEGNVITYGRLYTWWAVSDLLCPVGWHVSTHEEVITLRNFLGGENVAGGKLKESGTTHWNSPNTGATNETGFKALPGGYRHDYGTFEQFGNEGRWWVSLSDLCSIQTCESYLMEFNSSKVISQSNPKSDGLSVRCVKDN